jgi:hypothetical protein
VLYDYWFETGKGKHKVVSCETHSSMKEARQSLKEGSAKEVKWKFIKKVYSKFNYTGEG